MSYERYSVTRNWKIHCINQVFDQIFDELPLLGYRRNKSLQALLESKNIVNDKVVQTNNESKKTGYSIHV